MVSPPIHTHTHTSARVQTHKRPGMQMRRQTYAPMLVYAHKHSRMHTNSWTLTCHVNFLHLWVHSMKSSAYLQERNIIWQKKDKENYQNRRGNEDIDRLINFLHQCFVYFLTTSSFFMTWKFSSKNPQHSCLIQIDCNHRGFDLKCTHWNYDNFCFKGIGRRVHFSSQMINVCTSWWTCYAFLGTEKC